MKRRNYFRRKSRVLLLAALAVAVAVWSGYHAERRARDGAGAPEVSVKRMVKRIVTPAAKRAGTDRLEELRQAIGRKFPSRQETAALWSVVRGFSAEEVKSALEMLPKETDRRVNDEIVSMLYYRWAQLDPETAGEAVLAEGNEWTRYHVGSVFAAWSQSDPEAAIRWGRDKKDTPAFWQATQLAARQWVSEDPETALSRAREESPNAERLTMNKLVAKLSGTPESRQQLFAILAEEAPKDIPDHFFTSLAFSFGQIDPARIEELAGEMATAGLTEEVVGRFRETFERYAPSKGTPPVLERSDPAGGHEAREMAYRNWVIQRPEEALSWVESHGESGLISISVAEFADNLLASSWSPGREGHDRTADSVRKQFAVWQRLDAPTAEAWLATLPTDLRNEVATATPNDDATR